MPDPVVLFACVILLVPMGYFLLAAPAFLLVKLDIPSVTQLLRGMFNAYFLAMTIAGAIGTLAFALEGRLAVALGIALIAAFAVSARRAQHTRAGCAWRHQARTRPARRRRWSGW